MIRGPAFLAALLLLFAAAVASCHNCPQPGIKGFGGGDLGDPCFSQANCGRGLACRDIYLVPNYPDPIFTSNACTTDCDSGCPVGAACGNLVSMQPDGTLLAIQDCLPACNTDEDCFTGITSGTCDAGACYRTQCIADTDCPPRFTCEIPATVCCVPGQGCPFGGPVPGYCRRPLNDAGQ